VTKRMRGLESAFPSPWYSVPPVVNWPHPAEPNGHADLGPSIVPHPRTSQRSGNIRRRTLRLAGGPRVQGSRFLEWGTISSCRARWKRAPRHPGSTFGPTITSTPHPCSRIRDMSCRHRPDIRQLTLLAVLAIAAAAPLAARAQSRRPNIIFMFSDDQRWDALGANGNAVIQTPHLDRLAHGGLNFRNCFVTTSICAVSRASVLSGQYARRHGVLDFHARVRGVVRPGERSGGDPQPGGGPAARRDLADAPPEVR